MARDGAGGLKSLAFPTIPAYDLAAQQAMVQLRVSRTPLPAGTIVERLRGGTKAGRNVLDQPMWIGV